MRSTSHDLLSRGSLAKVDDALALDGQEMIDGEDYFKSQLESFGKNTLLEPMQLL